MRRNLLLLVLFLGLCLLPGCASSPTVSYFPVQQTSGPSLTALTSGKLVLENGCIRLKWDGGSDLLIWPYGYSYRISGSLVEVVDDKGNMVARTGQCKQLGGGEVPSIEPYTGKPSPANCSGPYWLVGSGIKNLYPWDSDALRELFFFIVVIVLALWLFAMDLMRLRKPRT
jgi:hypothetical protein